MKKGLTVLVVVCIAAVGLACGAGGARQTGPDWADLMSTGFCPEVGWELHWQHQVSDGGEADFRNVGPAMYVLCQGQSGQTPLADMHVTGLRCGTFHYHRIYGWGWHPSYGLHSGYFDEDGGAIDRYATFWTQPCPPPPLPPPPPTETTTRIDLGEGAQEGPGNLAQAADVTRHCRAYYDRTVGLSVKYEFVGKCTEHLKVFKTCDTYLYQNNRVVDYHTDHTAGNPCFNRVGGCINDCGVITHFFVRHWKAGRTWRTGISGAKWCKTEWVTIGAWFEKYHRMHCLFADGKTPAVLPSPSGVVISASGAKTIAALKREGLILRGRPRACAALSPDALERLGGRCPS